PTETSESDNGKGWWREGPIATDFKHEEVFPHLTDTVLDTIEKWKDDPFFIYYALPAPHTPILPTEEYRGKTGLNEYGDFVYIDRNSTRLNSSHVSISYAVFCLKKKKSIYLFII